MHIGPLVIELKIEWSICPLDISECENCPFYIFYFTDKDTEKCKYVNCSFRESIRFKKNMKID